MFGELGSRLEEFQDIIQKTYDVAFGIGIIDTSETNAATYWKNNRQYRL